MNPKYYQKIIAFIIILDIINIIYLQNLVFFIIITIIYIADFLLCYYLYRNKFLFSFTAVINAFIISTSFSGKARLFVIIRLLNLIKKSELKILQRILNRIGFKVIVDAVLMSKNELIYFLKLIVVIFLFSGFIIYNLEKASQPDVFKSVLDGYWWTFETMTTVGYGDIYPITVAGQVFAIIITFFSYGIIIVPSSIIASNILYTKRKTNYLNEFMKIKELRDSNVITSEEYDVLRQNIFKSIAK